MKIILLLLITSILVGSCPDSDKAKPHTQIYVEAINLHIWTYLPIKEIQKDGINIKIPQNGKITITENTIIVLENGNIVEFNDFVKVNGKVVNKDILNIFILENGEVKENEYIRTFK